MFQGLSSASLFSTPKHQNQRSDPFSDRLVLSLFTFPKKSYNIEAMREKTFCIRRAKPEDLAAITAIYNEAVLNSLATFHIFPRSEEDQKEWFAEHDERYPLLVFEEEGEILGWASLNPYSDREGYRYTVTDSVYVRRDSRRRSIGFALLSALIESARELSYHSILAFIAYDNLASILLHEKAGFVRRGELREVGYKFGKFVDVVIYQKMLKEGDRK